MYAALLKLTNRRTDTFVTVGEVCKTMGILRTEVDRLVRALEQRGLVVCAPATGRAAVVGLTRIDDQAFQA